MLNIGKTFHFDSAHYIEGHPKCGKVHGHTFTLTVELLDCELDDRGVVIDFHDLGNAVKDFLRHIDHSNINEVLTYIPTITAETLVEEIAKELSYRLKAEVNPTPKYKTIRCRLQEGFGGWAECTMEA